MAANTITGQQILFKVARDTRQLKAGLVTATSDTTHLRIGALTDTSDDVYNGALMREQGASTIAVVSDYTGSTREFTLASALAPAIGDRYEWCWWEATERIYAWEAINEAIRQAQDVWRQDTEVDAASATLTLATGTHTYALPTGIGKLLQVGIQENSADPISWFDPAEAAFEVYGQAGAYTLVFRPGFQYRYISGRSWSDRVRVASIATGTFADAFTGRALCLRYVTWESELVAETGTTQLPLDYFWVASKEYVENALNDASRLDLVTANVNVPLIQQKAAEARKRLELSKPRMRQFADLKW